MRSSAYRRLVLGLQSGRMDRSAFRVAAFMARSLKLKMLAVLVEDQSLVRAANLPIARELVLPTYDWRPTDPARLARELSDEAEQVRLHITQEIRDLGVECDFEVRRGDPAAAIIEQCNVHDVIAVIDSVDAIERLGGTAKRMRQAALASEASVLLLPPPHAPQPEGPVMVVALDFHDEVVATASQIADVSERELLVLMAGPGTAENEPSGAQVRLSRGAVTMPLIERSASGVVRTLGHRRGHCLVMNRSVIDLTASALDHLSNELGMPVLMTEGPA